MVQLYGFTTSNGIKLISWNVGLNTEENDSICKKLLKRVNDFLIEDNAVLILQEVTKPFYNSLRTELKGFNFYNAYSIKEYPESSPRFMTVIIMRRSTSEMLEASQKKYTSKDYKNRFVMLNLNLFGYSINLLGVHLAEGAKGNQERVKKKSLTQLL